MFILSLELFNLSAVACITLKCRYFVVYLNERKLCLHEVIFVWIDMSSTKFHAPWLAHFGEPVNELSWAYNCLFKWKHPWIIVPLRSIICRWCGGQVVLGGDSSSLATYGVIHISLGHISAQVHILGVSCHPFICTFHFIWHFGWPSFL